jgi:hypothetical protein
MEDTQQGGVFMHSVRFVYDSYKHIRLFMIFVLSILGWRKVFAS